MTTQEQERLTEEQAQVLIKQVKPENWKAYWEGDTLYGYVASASIEIENTRRKYFLFGDEGNRVKISINYLYMKPDRYVDEEVFNSFISSEELNKFYNETSKRANKRREEEITTSKRESLEKILAAIK